MLTALDAARRGALRLLARLPEQPRALRVCAEGVDIALEWAGPEASRAAAAAAPGAPPASPVAGDSTVEGGAAGGDAADTGRHEVRAPTIGIFHTSDGAESEPLVRVGDAVEPGQVVAVVRQLSLAIPVKADVAGTVAEALRTDGEPVEHDDLLFVLDRRRGREGGPEAGRAAAQDAPAR